MALLADCSAALDAEKVKLTETMMASLSKGEAAPQLVTEKMAAVQQRLAALEGQVETGELTMDMWLAQLKRAIARDEILQEVRIILLHSAFKRAPTLYTQSCL